MQRGGEESGWEALAVSYSNKVNFVVGKPDHVMGGNEKPGQTRLGRTGSQNAIINN